MSDLISPFAEWAAAMTELFGILIIIGFSIHALIFAALRLTHKSEPKPLFDDVRQRLGRGILLGLEFLVAADIIHTVAVELTFKSIGVLAAILVIRTFLSITLELELTGRWPWQRLESEQ